MAHWTRYMLIHLEERNHSITSKAHLGVSGWLFSRKTPSTQLHDTSDPESGLVRSRNAHVSTKTLPGFYAVVI
jgi:hypothetical protein